MKIAIIMSGQAVEPGGGVRMQGLMWRDGLQLLGHEVDLVNFWEEHDWKSYDAIIILQFVGLFKDIMELLSKNNNKIAIAPIIDPHRSRFIYKFLCKYIRLPRLHLFSYYNNLYDGCKYGNIFLTRSKQETEYLSYCCEISSDKIFQIPLSLRFEPLSEVPQKENFCLHVSRLAAYNKNVDRLIKAAKKYRFKLVLVGYLHGEQEHKWLNDLIDGDKNIIYAGALSDDELKDYYKRAKVIALPSLVEGVGMVAMEAAAYGCEVVLTNIGAPKEYWNGLARLVDPYSVDDIGKAICSSIESGYSQPQLLDFISRTYSINAVSERLAATLSLMTNK